MVLCASLAIGAADVALLNLELAPAAIESRESRPRVARSPALPAARSSPAAVEHVAVQPLSVDRVATLATPPPTAQRGADALPQPVMLYFVTSRARLSSAARAALEVVGETLAATPSLRVSIEGHTDARGTRHANEVLGLVRAERARSVLVAQGVDWTRIDLASFGESRPARTAHDDASYALNRRVEIHFQRGPP